MLQHLKRVHLACSVDMQQVGQANPLMQQILAVEIVELVHCRLEDDWGVDELKCRIDEGPFSHPWASNILLTRIL